MSEPWVSGVFALLGAVVGGSFTAFGARRAQKHEDEKQRRERADQARVAARILQADTQTCVIRLRRALRTHRWWSPTLPLPLESWPSYREQVARYMPLASWQEVSMWFQTAAATQASATRAHTEESGQTFLSLELPVVRQNVELTITRAEEALVALESFTGDHLPTLPELSETDGGPDLYP